jgi:hypothetical protein
MFAGGVADGLADGLVEGLGAAKETGTVSASEDRTVEVTSRDRLTVFLGADTDENVHATGREVPPPTPPRAWSRIRGGDT